MTPIGFIVLCMVAWGVVGLFRKDSFPESGKKPCHCTTYHCQCGFGLVEAVLAMFIAGIVVSVIMATMVASVRNMDRTIDTHEAITTSENASTVFRAATENGEWDTAYVTPERMIWLHGTTCEEWQFTAGEGGLARKQWEAGEAYPAAWETVLVGVTGGTLGLEDSTFRMTVTVKVEESLPVVTERLSMSTFEVPAVTDPPVERSNPCIA
jgi:type II secretory pathway pseudopilin PulG